VVNAAPLVHVTLNQVRWTEDLAVSGTVDKPMVRSGTVRARLQLAMADAPAGELTVEWPEDSARSSAGIHGTLAGAAVHARTPAP
jgi:hypothetical protein